MAEKLPVSDDFATSRRMKTATYEQQYRRQHLAEGWEPRGFERFQYQRALLHEMPVIGGPSDPLLAAPARYASATPCQDTLECICDEKGSEWK